MRNILLKALGCINSILLFQLRIVKVNYRFKKLGRMVPDYVRFGALQLLFLEIKENQVEGCMAELGVYRGDFARHINRAFPDRILYLFDTFEGFDKKDLQYDKENDFSNLSEGCTNTSADYVLKREPFARG